MIRKLEMATIACVVGLSACGGGDDTSTDAGTTPPAVEEAVADPDGGDALVADRLDEIQSAVDAWTSAGSVAEARLAAETAINLVSGPNGPFSGDLDADGVVLGESEVGLLSGVDGTPAGLATALRANACVVRDVLGSTADDAAAGWAETEAAIEAWRPDDNTMPSLLSHPMRVVGWATFTLASDDLDEALEYAGHAQLHVDIARAALDCRE